MARVIVDVDMVEHARLELAKARKDEASATTQLRKAQQRVHTAERALEAAREAESAITEDFDEAARDVAYWNGLLTAAKQGVTIDVAKAFIAKMQRRLRV